MNLAEINAFRVSHGLAAIEVNKPKKKNNNKALRAQENRDIKSMRTGGKKVSK